MGNLLIFPPAPLKGGMCIIHIGQDVLDDLLHCGKS